MLRWCGQIIATLYTDISCMGLAVSPSVVIAQSEIVDLRLLSLLQSDHNKHPEKNTAEMLNGAGWFCAQNQIRSCHQIKAIHFFFQPKYTRPVTQCGYDQHVQAQPQSTLKIEQCLKYKCIINVCVDQVVSINKRPVRSHQYITQGTAFRKLMRAWIMTLYYGHDERQWNPASTSGNTFANIISVFYI